MLKPRSKVGPSMPWDDLMFFLFRVPRNRKNTRSSHYWKTQMTLTQILRLTFHAGYKSTDDTLLKLSIHPKQNVTHALPPQRLLCR
jgi:hypothetical protein